MPPGYANEITVVIRSGGAVDRGANHAKQIYILLLMKKSFFIITPESHWYRPRATGDNRNSFCTEPVNRNRHYLSRLTDCIFTCVFI